MTDLGYMKLVAYKHINEEKLLLDRLAAEARTKHNFSAEQEQVFRMERACVWRALGELLEIRGYFDHGHTIEWDSVGVQIEKLRREGKLQAKIEKALARLNGEETQAA